MTEDAWLVVIDVVIGALLGYQFRKLIEAGKECNNEQQETNSKG